MDHDKTTSFIRTLLEKLGVTIDRIEQVSTSAHELYNIHTSDSKRLIGPQGEHLRALNYLLRRLLERVEGEADTRFMVDVNGYHQSRVREIEQKASILADRVRTFRSSAEMTPMNAYERMIIHALFSNDPDITTESEGAGKTRRVVLKYRSSV